MKDNFLNFAFIFMFFIEIINALGKEHISDQIILKVGDIEITEYEFEKNLEKFRQGYQNKYKQNVPPDSIKEWINEFINETIILANAWHQGYYQNKEINEFVENYARKILVQEHGLLYHELITKNISLDSLTIKQAYQKHSIQFKMDYIWLKNPKEMFNISIPKNRLMSSDSFDLMARKCQINKECCYDSCYFSWPSARFWEIQDQIFQLQIGEVSQPLYSHQGVFIVRITDRKSLMPPPFDLIKDYLIERLHFIEEERQFQNYKNEINIKAKVQINQRLFDQIATTILAKDEGNPFVLDTLVVFEFLNETAFSYLSGSKRRKITVRDLLWYYNQQPMRKRIKDKWQFNDLPYQMVYEDYAFRHAAQLELDKTLRFKLDRKNFKNRVILNKIIDEKVQVTEDELYNEYKSRVNEFIKGEKVIVSIFIFNKFDNAKAIREILNKNKFEDFEQVFKDDSVREKVIIFEINKHIHYLSQELPKELIDICFMMEDRSTSALLPIPNEKILLIAKLREEGIRILPFHEVKSVLKNELMQKKREKTIQQMAIKLKDKFFIENLIKIDFYKNLY